jgi:tRNA threonylcarbamoyladenosine biosynthesis protein TsaB
MNPPMARIVAFDTTSQLGSFALVQPGGVAAERVVVEPDGFSPILFGVLEDLLAQAGWPMESVSAFAAAAGPGSFTGIRVGLTAAKGLAEALGRPAFGVSNLRAIASLGGGDLRAPWIDARRGEVYGGLYDGGLAEIAPPVVMPFGSWQARLPAGHQLIPGDGVPLARAIGRLALEAYLRGERPDPISLDAEYVRRSDAELFWRDR